MGVPDYGTHGKELSEIGLVLDISLSRIKSVLELSLEFSIFRERMCPRCRDLEVYSSSVGLPWGFFFQSYQWQLGIHLLSVISQVEVIEHREVTNKL